jgi:hypothetical protein
MPVPSVVTSYSSVKLGKLFVTVQRAAITLHQKLLYYSFSWTALLCFIGAYLQHELYAVMQLHSLLCTEQRMYNCLLCTALSSNCAVCSVMAQLQALE